MPDPSASRTTSRDFAFQSTDQSFAHQFGGAEGASSSSAYPPHSHDRYESEQITNASGASSAPSQPSAQGASVRYTDFSAHQSSLQQQAAPTQFPSYGFSPGGPLVWDWNNSIDFPDFTNHYEPQGELVQELQNQRVPNNDFSIPVQITNSDTVYQSPQQTQVPNPTNVQNPLSPPPKPPQRPVINTGMKRKAESEPSSAVSQAASVSGEPQHPAKRANKSRSSSSASVTSPAVATTSDEHRSSMTQTTAATAATETAPQPTTTVSNDGPQKKQPSKGTGPQGRVIDVSKPRRIVESPAGADILPAGKVFPIQIGSEMFRLSGASISSDAPSYFSHFFGEQLHSNQGRAGDLRTLYIDRDPDTFRHIVLHLQGYHVKPKDEEQFVKLFADAQFYSLPRLTKQLFSTDIFIRIGSSSFQIPRDLFSSPGDSTNYFTLGFAQFFSTPSHVFPGLDRNALLRPPSISPPSVPSKSGETFAEIIKLLKGYDVEIRNDAHRSQLLKDARWFHLRGLEQKLIPCNISYNLKRDQTEILIRLEDIRQSGISFTPDNAQSNSSSSSGSTAPSAIGVSPGPATSKPASPAPSLSGPQFKPGTVSYARPYTDDHANTNILILEISSTESTTLHFPINPPKPIIASSLTLDLRATFRGDTLARISSLFSVVASKMGLPATQPLGLMLLQSGGGVATQPVSPANSGVSERRVRVRISSDCYIEIDNTPVELGVDTESGRLGVKRNSVERRIKRARVSEERHEYEGAVEPRKSDWIWGGGKANDVGALSADGEEQEEEWIIKKAHWRLRVEPVDGEGGKMHVVLCGVRIEGHSNERSRNQNRGFLSKA